MFGEARPEGSPLVTGRISTVTLFESYPWRAWAPEFLDNGWEWAPRPFDSSIADAWLVVEKLAEVDLWVSFSNMNHGCYRNEPGGPPFLGWHAEVCNVDREDEHGPIPVTHSYTEEPWEGYAATAPEAICLAALAALSQGDGE